MNQRQRLQNRLKQAREFSEALLASFKTPADWTHQVYNSANHALWFAGHMATTDNFFISVVAPKKARELSGYQEKFGMGSQPTSNPADYPPPIDVLENMRERRAALLSVLAELSEEDLERKTPQGTPEFLPDVASVFEAAIWHEGMHSGQVTIARRSLGHAPLFSAGG